MKQLVFVIHGIGKNGPNWSKEITDCLSGLARTLPNSPECKGPQIKDALSQVEFIELYYDDFLQEVTRKCFERRSETLAYFKSVGLSGLDEIFTDDASQDSFLRDNIFDVVVYRLYQEHRWAIQRMVMKQIKQGLAEAASTWGLGNVKVSMLAHSLGTIVTHDVLNELAREEGQFSYANGWYFDNVFMLANVSALAQNEFNPRESFVRPFLSPGRPGYVRNYYDFAHSLDPVAQAFSYKRWMKDVPADGFNFFATDHFYDKNIHGYTHYLKSPKVYVPLFFGLFGGDLFKRAFVKRVLSGEETLKTRNVSNKLIEELKRDLPELLKDQLGWESKTFAKGCALILDFLKRLK